MRTRLTVAFGLAAAAVLSCALPASADYGNRDSSEATGELLDDGSGASVSAGYLDGDDSEEATRRGGYISNVVCRYYYDGTGEPVDFDDIQPYEVYRDCTSATGEYAWADVIYLTPRDPMVLAYEAKTVASRNLPLPLPGVRTNPPPERDQLVRVPVWLWLDGGWAPQSGTASAGPVSARVTATPTSVEWSMGDGNEVRCAGPGRAYDDARRADSQTTDCSYAYRHSSAAQPGERFRVTATVTWAVSWTSSIGAGGSLGTVRRTTTFALRVAEAQAVNR